MGLRDVYITSFNVLGHELLLLAFVFVYDKHKEEHKGNDVEHHDYVERGHESEDAHRGCDGGPCVDWLDEDEGEDTAHEERELCHSAWPKLALAHDDSSDEQYGQCLRVAHGYVEVDRPRVFVEVRLAQEVNHKVRHEDGDQDHL